MKRRVFLSSNLIVLVTFLASCLQVQGSIEKEMEKTFNAAYGGELKVDTERGSMSIETHSSETVNVKVYYKVRSNDEDFANELIDDYEIDFFDNGKDLRIEAEFSGEFSNSEENKLNVKFVITVPSEYNVDLRTSGGSISVDELQGNAQARTSGGSLNFKFIDGMVRGKTSGGSISLDGCNGDAKVSTSGGGIYLGKVRGSVEAHTSGGSITVDEVYGTIDASTSGGSVTATLKEQPKSDCKLTTSGGSISVYLSEDIKADIDAKTSSGSVNTDFPVSFRGKVKSSELKGEINGGGPEIYLRTSGGGININSL
jgi:DUF4097 and DUF4098 domain-containing protein YvlB